MKLLTGELWRRTTCSILEIAQLFIIRIIFDRKERLISYGNDSQCGVEQAGVERTYHSLDEMPPEIRAAVLEAEQQSKTSDRSTMRLNWWGLLDRLHCV